MSNAAAAARIVYLKLTEEIKLILPEAWKKQ